MSAVRAVESGLVAVGVRAAPSAAWRTGGSRGDTKRRAVRVRLGRTTARRQSGIRRNPARDTYLDLSGAGALANRWSRKGRDLSQCRVWHTPANVDRINPDRPGRHRPLLLEEETRHRSLGSPRLSWPMAVQISPTLMHSSHACGKSGRGSLGLVYGQTPRLRCSAGY